MGKHKKGAGRAFGVLAAVIAVGMGVYAMAALFWMGSDFGELISHDASLSEQNPAELSPKNKQEILGTYIIGENRKLPKDTTICVKEGGRLFISEGAKVTLKGALEIEEGGALFVDGTMISAEDSVIRNDGELDIGGALSLGGKLFVNESGVVCGDGALEVVDGFSDISCAGSVSAQIVPPPPAETDGVTTIGGIVVANREFSLPKNYGSSLDRAAYLAFLEMKSASGYDMTIISGFRSYEKQDETFKYWVSVDGFEFADTYSAQPGHSDHQTGLAIDVSSLEQDYGDTDEGRWLAEHCWEYGFVLRYPEGCEEITGYIYEPWHIRYLGKSTAKLVHDSGLALEQFLGVPANYHIDG